MSWMLKVDGSAGLAATDVDEWAGHPLRPGGHLPQIGRANFRPIWGRTGGGCFWRQQIMTE